MTKEYLVEYRIKNGLLFNKIKETGCETITEFCEKYKFGKAAIGHFLNLQRTVFKKDGSLDKQAERLLELFQATPDELFPARQFNQKLLDSKKTFFADEEDLIQIDNLIGSEPEYNQFQIEEDLQDKEDLIARLMQGLDSLNPKERQVVKLYYGIDCQQMNFYQMAKMFGRTVESIRQKFQSGISKLQHPKRRLFIKTGEKIIKTSDNYNHPLLKLEEYKIKNPTV
jgi:RNA polymerase sigma factor (sigma-70 family)